MTTFPCILSPCLLSRPLRRARLSKFLIVLATLLLVGCGPSSDSKSGTTARVGLSGITQNFDGSATSWKTLLDGAEEAGVTLLHHQMPSWSEAERSAGIFDFSYFSELTRDTRSRRFEFSVDIATPLGLAQIDVPSDVTFTSFNDPGLLRRYLTYVDAALQVFPSVSYVILHTETVESFFSGDLLRKDLGDYCEFISKTIEHIHQVRPSVKVGVYGTQAESAETLACLNRETDFFGVSYFADRGDADHLSILRRLVNLNDGKPILIFEAGVPTAPFLGGSEQRQVDFIDDLSRLIAELGQSLVAVSYCQHRDDSLDIVMQYVQQIFTGFSSAQREELIAFYSSLGLKRSDGSHKLGWSRFVRLNNEP